MKTAIHHGDEFWMSLALSEAEKGRGKTSPNPMVGAVLVRKNQLLGSGHHRRAGLAHAEVEALKKTKVPKGATLYVTLEPCCHTQKRTPPCVAAIKKAGIKKVVIGTLDPNPQVRGRGIRQLKQAGIQTKVGVLAEACLELNVFYNHWIQKKTPWVILKVASSLDGRIALASGKSKWITSEAARKFSHGIRSQVDGILVGIGTVQADNPRLTARKGNSLRQPIRIILDPQLKISPGARVLSKLKGTSLIVTRPEKISGPKGKGLIKKGIELIGGPLNPSGYFDLKKLMKLLGKRGLVSLLVEGGPKVWSHFVQQKCFHEIHLYLAPKLLGEDAIPLLGPQGMKNLNSGPSLEIQSAELLGPDFLLKYRVSESGRA